MYHGQLPSRELSSLGNGPRERAETDPRGTSMTVSTTRRHYLRRVAFVVATWALVPGVQAAVPWNADDLADALSAVPLGVGITVEQVPLAGDLEAARLSLRPVRVFSKSVEVVVHGPDGRYSVPPPGTLRFVGEIVEVEGSRVLLSVSEGAMRLLAVGGGRAWVGAWGRGERAPAPRELDARELRDAGRAFSCGSEDLALLGELLQPTAEAPHAAGAGGAKSARLPGHTARVAVETDYEFFQKFGSVTDATDYVGDLMAFVSSIYEAEVDTSILVQHLSLWTTSADPWGQSSTLCGLFEFGRFWNDHRSHVNRTIAHFMSGKSNGGGVAWVGVLCAGGFDYDHGGSCPGLSPQVDGYGGGYGYSGDMDGNFNPANPGIVWDVVVVAHEMGHNFNSPHTHCYGGIGGSSEPVDRCHNGEGGCWAGAASLPCSQAGAGCGTLMSYCHLRSGGLGNISPTFGEGHPWGVLPERVPDRMGAHVAARAASNPGCLELTIPELLFSDGFETGATGAWSLTSP